MAFSAADRGWPERHHGREQQVRWRDDRAHWCSSTAPTAAATPTIGVNILGNTFDIQSGAGLVTEATGSQVKGNLFTGTASGAELDLRAAGGDVQQNTFSATGAPHILDSAGAYTESTLIGQNSFTVTWVYDRAATACSRR